MSLSLTAATRINPAPCDHFALTIDDDGQSRTVRLSQAEIANLFDDLPYNFRVVLVLLWIRYKRSQGATLASLVGQVVVSS